LLTGQIDVENPDINYRFSNIESTATVNTICRRRRDFTVEKGIVNDRKVKTVTFILKFGSQGSINVMFEVKVKLDESVVSLTTSSAGYIRCNKLLKLFFSDKNIIYVTERVVKGYNLESSYLFVLKEEKPTGPNVFKIYSHEAKK